MIFTFSPNSTHRKSIVVCGFVVALFGITSEARAQYTLSSTNFAFGNTTVGLMSNGVGTVVKNIGSSPVNISNLTVDNPQFHLIAGVVPWTLAAKQQQLYEIYFQPTVPGTATGNMTLTINGSPVVVTLSGTGTTTGAVASLTATSLSFANQPLGTMSPSQKVTATNSGTSALTVTNINIQPPFAITPVFSKAIVLQPGNSTSVNVSFFGATPGATTGALTFSYDVLSSSGLSLSGTATAAQSFAITSFPTLPVATKGGPYLAVLQAVSGVGPITWSTTSGSLPPGLSLSNGGTITGTVSSTATLGTYSFTVQAMDSNSPPNTVAAHLSITLKSQTGANCNNITWNIPNSTSPLLDLPDLGTGYYQGIEQGGLYPNGSNVPPPAHNADGVTLAKGIVPLDANGNPSPNGKYVLLSLGVSTARDTFNAFQAIAIPDPAVNSNLVIVNGAQPDATANYFSNPSSAFWSTLLNSILPDFGVTANQVVAVWYQDILTAPKGNFPSDMNLLQTDIEATMQNVHTFFPNASLAYLSPFEYAGYCNGVAAIILEPYGYENAFAVKNAIADQLNGSASLNYNPANGPVMAPWMSWGPYLWANGMLANSTGLAFTCPDAMGDCRHPSSTLGAPKLASMMLNFFKTDNTTAPWFLAPTGNQGQK